MSRNEIADFYNRYEIIVAAKEAGIHLADPVWNKLSDKEKWEVIINKNGQNILKKSIDGYQPKSQEEIILEIIKKRNI